jgi:hypothetical protein
MSSHRAGVSTKRASAVALEAFTEVALAARRHPRRRVLPGLALSALGDDTVDALGLLAARWDLATAGGVGAAGWRYRHLTPACSTPRRDDPCGVVVVLRELRWRLSRQVVPRLGPRHALAAGEGWTARPVRCGGTHDALGVLEVARTPGRCKCSGCRWAPARSCTRWWKISVHAAIAAGAATVLLPVFGRRCWPSGPWWP